MARRSSEPPISWLMKSALERPGLISLAAGFTDNESLPVAEVNEIVRDLLRRPKSARASLQYGTTIGLPQLRHELLRRWQHQDQNPAARITPADVVITNGSQQLLYLITETLCDPGDIVLVEDPTYFVYLGIVEAMGLRTFGFANLDTLKCVLQRLKKQRLLPRLKLLYLVTYFQNPTGRTWSAADKREALAIVKHYERAAGHPIYVLEDAAYRDLRFTGTDTPSMLAYDRRPARVIHTNTLTKPFATGLKVGYGILPSPVMTAVLRAKSNHDFGTANFLQAILARALADGHYDRHLRVIAATYRKKRDAMVAALRAYMTAARFEVPLGGLYVWTELPARVKTGVRSRLFQGALDAGVLYVPGEMCYARDTTRKAPGNFMRLSFGAQPVAQIEKGIRLLANALEKS